MIDTSRLFYLCKVCYNPSFTADEIYTRGEKGMQVVTKAYKRKDGGLDYENHRCYIEGSKEYGNEDKLYVCNKCGEEIGSYDCGDAIIQESDVCGPVYIPEEK